MLNELETRSRKHAPHHHPSFSSFSFFVTDPPNPAGAHQHAHDRAHAIPIAIADFWPKPRAHVRTVAGSKWRAHGHPDLFPYFRADRWSNAISVILPDPPPNRESNAPAVTAANEIPHPRTATSPICHTVIGPLTVADDVDAHFIADALSINDGAVSGAV
jgi:hypothetical protein